MIGLYVNLTNLCGYLFIFFVLSQFYFSKYATGQESWRQLSSNENGIRLVGIAESKNHIINNTYFSRKNTHKHTWTAPDGKAKSEIVV